jgi:hypothetical protein
MITIALRWLGLALDAVKTVLAPILAFLLGVKHQKATELKRTAKELKKENDKVYNAPRTDIDTLKRLRRWRDKAND